MTAGISMKESLRMSMLFVNDVSFVSYVTYKSLTCLSYDQCWGDLNYM